jgi:hypothetical protein
MKRRICPNCHKSFVPDKYHPNQQFCSSPQCQHRRQILNQRNWRLKNPNYFKYRDQKTAWEKKRAQYLKFWRQNHKDYFKNWRLKRAFLENNNKKEEKKQKFGFSLDN